MRLSPQQQQAASQEINAALEKMQLSWSNELKQWHPLALKALNYASAASLNIPQPKWRELLQIDTHGLSANVVALLCNNLEGRQPQQMNVDAHEWADVLDLNQQIANDWEALCAPVRDKIIAKYEKQNDKPIIHTMNTAK
jgi:hypothetical protein